MEKIDSLVVPCFSRDNDSDDSCAKVCRDNMPTETWHMAGREAINELDIAFLEDSISMYSDVFEFGEYPTVSIEKMVKNTIETAKNDKKWLLNLACELQKQAAVLICAALKV